MGNTLEYNQKHKSIILKLETHNQLTLICKKNQSYDNVISLLLNQYEESK